MAANSAVDPSIIVGKPFNKCFKFLFLENIKYNLDVSFWKGQVKAFSIILSAAINDVTKNEHLLKNMIQTDDITVRNDNGQNYLHMVCASNLGNVSGYYGVGPCNPISEAVQSYTKAKKLMSSLITTIIAKGRIDVNEKDMDGNTAMNLINSNSNFSEEDKKEFCALLSLHST